MIFEDKRRVKCRYIVYCNETLNPVSLDKYLKKVRTTEFKELAIAIVISIIAIAWVLLFVGPVIVSLGLLS